MDEQPRCSLKDSHHHCCNVLSLFVCIALLMFAQYPVKSRVSIVMTSIFPSLTLSTAPSFKGDYLLMVVQVLNA